MNDPAKNSEKGEKPQKVFIVFLNGVPRKPAFSSKMMAYSEYARLSHENSVLDVEIGEFPVF